MPTHHELMTLALDLAVQARERGDHPFGALLAVDGQVVATARNRVTTNADITAHAELHLVRKLERAGQLDLLPQGVVYTSCEPCPMCVGAMFWAGAREVAYSLSHETLNTLATPPDGSSYGFEIGAPEIGARATPPLRISGPEREDESAKAHIGFWTGEA